MQFVTCSAKKMIGVLKDIIVPASQRLMKRGMLFWIMLFR